MSLVSEVTKPLLAIVRKRNEIIIIIIHIFVKFMF